MVNTAQRRNGSTANTAAQSDDSAELQAKEPKHWLQAGAVAVRSLPLYPECLSGEYIHKSPIQEREVNGQLVMRGGNETILDKDYVAYRLGILLTELGFSSEDINAGKPSLQLQNLVSYALNYYPATYNEQKAEIDRERLLGSRDKVISKAVAPMRQLLVLQGMTEAVSWSDEQVAEFIQNVLPSQQ